MNGKQQANDKPLFAHQELGEITNVCTGMLVVDSEGKTVGTIERVHMGNPGGAIAGGPAVTADDRFVALLGSLFGADFDIPVVKQRELLRVGFIKVDGPGFIDVDRFVRADKIGRVIDGTVYLTRTS